MYPILGKLFSSYLPKISLGDITLEEILEESSVEINQDIALRLLKIYPRVSGIYFLINDDNVIVKLGKSDVMFRRLYMLFRDNHYYNFSKVSVLLFSKIPTKIELNFTETFYHYQHQPWTSRVNYEPTSQFYKYDGKIEAPMKFSMLMQLQAGGISSQIMPFLHFIDWPNVMLTTS